MGLEPNTKAFRVLIGNEIRVSRHVTFSEEKFRSSGTVDGLMPEEHEEYDSDTNVSDEDYDVIIEPRRVRVHEDPFPPALVAVPAVPLIAPPPPPPFTPPAPEDVPSPDCPEVLVCPAPPPELDPLPPPPPAAINIDAFVLNGDRTTNVPPPPPPVAFAPPAVVG
jgi:hypothetical protein